MSEGNIEIRVGVSG